MCVPAASLLQYPVLKHPGNLAKLRLCLRGGRGGEGVELGAGGWRSSGEERVKRKRKVQFVKVNPYK